MAKVLVTVTDNDGGMSREDYTAEDIKKLEATPVDKRVEWQTEIIEAYKKPVGAEVSFKHIICTTGFLINDSL